MKNKTSSLFLIELICTVLLFSLCACVCLTAFAKADRVSREAEEQNHAVLTAQTLAECFTSDGSAALEQYGCRQTEDGRWTLHGEETAEILITREKNLEMAEICVRVGEESYTLTAARVSEGSVEG